MLPCYRVQKWGGAQVSTLHKSKQLSGLLWQSVYTSVQNFVQLHMVHFLHYCAMPRVNNAGGTLELLREFYLSELYESQLPVYNTCHTRLLITHFRVQLGK